MERFYGIPVIYNQTIVFFSSKRLSAFYMRVGKYIYEMDENFVPVKSFYAPFKGEEGYALIIDEADTPYIASYKSAKALADDKELKLKVLNLKNGNVDIRLIRGSILPGTTLVDDYYGKRLFAQPGRVNVYKDNVLE